MTRAKVICEIERTWGLRPDFASPLLFPEFLHILESIGTDSGGMPADGSDEWTGRVKAIKTTMEKSLSTLNSKVSVVVLLLLRL